MSRADTLGASRRGQRGQQPPPAGADAPSPLMVLPAAHVGHRQRRWPDPRPKPASPQNQQTLVPRSTRHLEAGQSLADLSAIEQGLLWGSNGLSHTRPERPLPSAAVSCGS